MPLFSAHYLMKKCAYTLKFGVNNQRWTSAPVRPGKETNLHTLWPFNPNTGLWSNYYESAYTLRFNLSNQSRASAPVEQPDEEINLHTHCNLLPETRDRRASTPVIRHGEEINLHAHYDLIPIRASTPVRLGEEINNLHTHYSWIPESRDGALLLLYDLVNKWICIHITV